MRTPSVLKISRSSYLILILCACFAGCASSGRGYDYTQNNKPRFASSHVIHKKQLPPEFLKIVTYNIKFADRIDEAIELLQSHEELRDADFVFLQEMDTAGVEQIATLLGYNYVYYPTSKHPYHQKDFGNAILSKWPLVEDEKIIFGPSRYVSRQRVAVRARAQVYDKSIELFNVHMHVKIKPHERAARLKTLIEKSKEESDYVIIAGDFNTYWPRESRYVREVLINHNFEWATSEVDWTFRHWVFLNKAYVLDYIFTRGFEILEVGAVEDRSASDHIPVWSVLKL